MKIDEKIESYLSEGTYYGDIHTGTFDINKFFQLINDEKINSSLALKLCFIMGIQFVPSLKKAASKND